MSRTLDGRFTVEHVIRGQWASLAREKIIRDTAKADGPDVNIYVEQEPGSGGKESAENTIRGLAGYAVYADKVTGDKETRAEPYAAQVQGRNVYLLRDEWNKGYVDELDGFPEGRFSDQVRRLIRRLQQARRACDRRRHGERVAARYSRRRNRWEDHVMDLLYWLLIAAIAVAVFPWKLLR